MHVNHYTMAADVHVGGEPLRMFNYLGQNGFRTSMSAYRDLFNQPACCLTWNRLLKEPRGHRHMVLCIVTPPVSKDAAAGLLFKSLEGDIPVPVHGLMGMATYLAETNLLKKEYVFDCFEGRYRVAVDFNGRAEKAEKVRTEQILALEPLRCEGEVLDAACWRPGGSRTVVLPTDSRLLIENLSGMQKRASQLCCDMADCGERISHVLFYHQNDDGMPSFLTISKEGQIDRSACNGAGALAAHLHHAKKALLNKPEPVVNFLGHQTAVKILDVDRNTDEYHVEVSGEAFITGFHQFIFDDTDPWKDGFVIG